MPFPAGSEFHSFLMAAVVAFQGPVLHQYGLAIREANHFRLATDKIRQQATGASVAVFIMISVIHRENAETPTKGPRDDQDLPSRG